MSQNPGGTNPPVNRAVGGSQANPPKVTAPTAPLPPSQTGRGAAPGAQVANPQGSSSQQPKAGTVYFRSSMPSTNLHMPTGGDVIRFRNNFYHTNKQAEIDFLRNDFVTRQAGPLKIEEVSEGDYKKGQQRQDDTVDMGVDIGSRRVNADGQVIVDPVVSPIPGQQNMMSYPQPPLNAVPPTPGPHIAPEVSTDPADEGGVKQVNLPIRTQANPGAPEESTTRPQDQPNVPADKQAKPDEAPAPRPEAK